MLPIIGLLFGSFLAALTWRTPRKLSNLKGRSFCDNCKVKLRWYDNIPLLSYILLRGKCRSCNKKISIRYALIELSTAIGFYFIGPNVPYLILFLILLAIFVIDYEHQIIPDNYVFLGIFVAILSLKQPLFINLYAGFLASIILLIIHLLTRGRGMGLGDVKFAVLGGVLVGLKLTWMWLFISFLTGGIVGIILILTRAAKLKDRIAFGPFLIVSIPITLIWGEKLLKHLHL